MLLRCRRCDRWFVEMAHMHYAWAPREISGELAKAMQNAPPELLHRAFNALQPAGSGELNVRSFEEILAG